MELAEIPGIRRGQGFRMKFLVSIVPYVLKWHRLPREVLDVPSLEVFQDRLDGFGAAWTSGRWVGLNGL